MKEEYLLERKFGRPRLFKVPEGYFERFENGIMNNLDIERNVKRPVRRWLRPVTWAACAVIAIVSAAVYFQKTNIGEGIAVNVHSNGMSQYLYNENIVDELSDFAMLDNDDLYSLMADD